MLFSKFAKVTKIYLTLVIPTTFNLYSSILGYAYDVSYNLQRLGIQTE